MGWREPVQAKWVVFEGQGLERAHVHSFAPISESSRMQSCRDVTGQTQEMGWKEPVQAKQVVFEGQGPERAYVQFCYCIWKQSHAVLQRCCSFSWYQGKGVCSPSCPVPWGEMRTASYPAASTLLQRRRPFSAVRMCCSWVSFPEGEMQPRDWRTSEVRLSSLALTLPAPWDPPLREEETALSTVLVLLLQELQLTTIKEQLLGTLGLMGLTTGGGFRDG